MSGGGSYLDFIKAGINSDPYVVPSHCERIEEDGSKYVRCFYTACSCNDDYTSSGLVVTFYYPDSAFEEERSESYARAHAERIASRDEYQCRVVVDGRDASACPPVSPCLYLPECTITASNAPCCCSGKPLNASCSSGQILAGCGCVDPSPSADGCCTYSNNECESASSAGLCPSKAGAFLVNFQSGVPCEPTCENTDPCFGKDVCDGGNSNCCCGDRLYPSGILCSDGEELSSDCTCRAINPCEGKPACNGSNTDCCCGGVYYRTGVICSSGTELNSSCTCVSTDPCASLPVCSKFTFGLPCCCGGTRYATGTGCSSTEDWNGVDCECYTPDLCTGTAACNGTNTDCCCGGQYYRSGIICDTGSSLNSSCNCAETGPCVGVATCTDSTPNTMCCCKGSLRTSGTGCASGELWDGDTCSCYTPDLCAGKPACNGSNTDCCCGGEYYRSGIICPSGRELNSSCSCVSTNPCDNLPTCSSASASTPCCCQGTLYSTGTGCSSVQDWDGTSCSCINADPCFGKDSCNGTNTDCCCGGKYYASGILCDSDQLLASNCNCIDVDPCMSSPQCDGTNTDCCCGSIYKPTGILCGSDLGVDPSDLYDSKTCTCSKDCCALSYADSRSGGTKQGCQDLGGYYYGGCALADRRLTLLTDRIDAVLGDSISYFIEGINLEPSVQILLFHSSGSFYGVYFNKEGRFAINDRFSIGSYYARIRVADQELTVNDLFRVSEAESVCIGADECTGFNEDCCCGNTYYEDGISCTDGQQLNRRCECEAQDCDGVYTIKSIKNYRGICDSDLCVSDSLPLRVEVEVCDGGTACSVPTSIRANVLGTDSPITFTRSLDRGGGIFEYTGVVSGSVACAQRNVSLEFDSLCGVSSKTVLFNVVSATTCSFSCTTAGCEQSEGGKYGSQRECEAKCCNEVCNRCTGEVEVMDEYVESESCSQLFECEQVDFQDGFVSALISECNNSSSTFNARVIVQSPTRPGCANSGENNFTVTVSHQDGTELGTLSYAESGTVPTLVVTGDVDCSLALDTTLSVKVSGVINGIDIDSYATDVPYNFTDCCDANKFMRYVCIGDNGNFCEPMLLDSETTGYGSYEDCQHACIGASCIEGEGCVIKTDGSGEIKPTVPVGSIRADYYVNVAALCASSCDIYACTDRCRCEPENRGNSILSTCEESCCVEDPFSCDNYTLDSKTSDNFLRVEDSFVITALGDARNISYTVRDASTREVLGVFNSNDPVVELYYGGVSQIIVEYYVWFTDFSLVVPRSCRGAVNSVVVTWDLTNCDPRNFRITSPIPFDVEQNVNELLVDSVGVDLREFDVRMQIDAFLKTRPIPLPGFYLIDCSDYDFDDGCDEIIKKYEDLVYSTLTDECFADNLKTNCLYLRGTPEFEVEKDRLLVRTPSSFFDIPLELERKLSEITAEWHAYLRSQKPGYNYFADGALPGFSSYISGKLSITMKSGSCVLTNTIEIGRVVGGFEEGTRTPCLALSNARAILGADPYDPITQSYTIDLDLSAFVSSNPPPGSVVRVSHSLYLLKNSWGKNSFLDDTTVDYEDLKLIGGSSVDLDLNAKRHVIPVGVRDLSDLCRYYYISGYVRYVLESGRSVGCSTWNSFGFAFSIEDTVQGACLESCDNPDTITACGDFYPDTQYITLNSLNQRAAIGVTGRRCRVFIDGVNRGLNFSFNAAEIGLTEPGTSRKLIVDEVYTNERNAGSQGPICVKERREITVYYKSPILGGVRCFYDLSDLVFEISSSLSNTSLPVVPANGIIHVAAGNNLAIRARAGLEGFVSDISSIYDVNRFEKSILIGRNDGTGVTSDVFVKLSVTINNGAEVFCESNTISFKIKILERDSQLAFNYTKVEPTVTYSRTTPDFTEYRVVKSENSDSLEIVDGDYLSLEEIQGGYLVRVANNRSSKITYSAYSGGDIDDYYQDILTLTGLSAV